MRVRKKYDVRADINFVEHLHQSWEVPCAGTKLAFRVFRHKWRSFNHLEILLKPTERFDRHSTAPHMRVVHNGGMDTVERQSDQPPINSISPQRLV